MAHTPAKSEPASEAKKPASPAKPEAGDPEDLLVTLTLMDDRARAQGFTLAQVLEWAASSAYGISIIGPPATADAPADD